MDNNSLAHSKWNCKYHIVFAPKYRRQKIMNYSAILFINAYILIRKHKKIKC